MAGGKKTRGVEEEEAVEPSSGEKIHGCRNGGIVGLFDSDEMADGGLGGSDTVQRYSSSVRFYILFL